MGRDDELEERGEIRGEGNSSPSPLSEGPLIPTVLCSVVDQYQGLGSEIAC